jgi:release factor family 2
MVRLSELPYLLPLMAWDQRSVPHVVVVLDLCNLADIAAETVELVRRVDARLLVLAGDGPNRALPEPCRRLAADVEHGGPANDSVQRAVDDLLADYRAAERDRRLVRFGAVHGNGLAVTGLRGTTAATGADVLAATGDEPEFGLSGGVGAIPRHA